VAGRINLLMHVAACFTHSCPYLVEIAAEVGALFLVYEIEFSKSEDLCMHCE
jgi:hypothetical protein